MRIRIKKIKSNAVIKMEVSGSIKDILIKEDILNPADETISVCFRGDKCSGIIDLKAEEIEGLYKAVKNKTHLIKDYEPLQGKK